MKPTVFSPSLMRNVCCCALRMMSSEVRQARANPVLATEDVQANLKVHPGVFHQCVTDIGISFFTGVPDSLLSDYSAYVHANESENNHVITANEGNTVGVASGYYLATGRPALAYLQNSGLGNMVNPLMSLTSPRVYSIPLLLLIGWRGEPGVKDEPQHKAQGEITPNMLQIMDIPCRILPTEESMIREILREARHHFEVKKAPFALIVRKSTFESYKLPSTEVPIFSLTREKALKQVVDAVQNTDIIVSSTGMLSRELFEYRESQGKGHEKEFLTVGCMGHASSIALGIAQQKPFRQVFCLDGDGAALMHLGALATIGHRAPSNFKHVIFNNGCHDSVGGQPTEAGNHDTFSFGDIALGCGYRKAFVASNELELESGLHELAITPGPAVLEIKLKVGSRGNLGRPTRTTIQNKEDFMDYLQQS